MAKKIAVLVGSLRKESYNRKMAHALIALAPEALKPEIVEIGGLPLYNQDLDDEGRPCAEWTTFRQHMSGFDGVLFVTPEYNRSVPGALKNAIDVGSRPYGKSIWDRKPGAVMSVSPGQHRRLRRKPSLEAIPRLPQCAGHAAARGLCRGRGPTLRCKGIHQRCEDP